MIFVEYDIIIEYNNIKIPIINKLTLSLFLNIPDKKSKNKILSNKPNKYSTNNLLASPTTYYSAYNRNALLTSFVLYLLIGNIVPLSKVISILPMLNIYFKFTRHVLCIKIKFLSKNSLTT